MQNAFKKIDFEKRKGEAERMLEKFPNRVPIIVLRSERSKLPELKQIKFLTPHDLTGECHEALNDSQLQWGNFFLLFENELISCQHKQYFCWRREKMETRSLIAWPRRGNHVHGVSSDLFSQPLSVIYEQYQDEDLFLYLTYCEEDPFGCAS